MVQFICLPFEELSLFRLYEILARRQEVFSVEQTCFYLDADGHDFQALHLMGLNTEGDIVAYARLLPQGVVFDDYQSIGRVLTTASVRRTGAGKILLEKALEEMEIAFGSGPIKISAQSYLIDFYRTFNFEIAGAEYLEDGIPHTPMVRL